MEKLRFFEEAGIGAMATLAVQVPVHKQRPSWEPGTNLEVDEKGILATPGTKLFSGFYLAVVFSKELKVAIVQRDLSRRHGQYFGYAVSEMEGMFGPGFNAWIMNAPMRVKTAGQEVWLPWKGSPSDPSNKVDCWIVNEGGHIDLFQVGIITHDNGKTFRLLGEYRWRGQLFAGGEAMPDDPAIWGGFGARKEILDNRDFRSLLPKLPVWQGKPEVLEPPLAPVPAGDYARLQWYSPFAGQTGQGPVLLHDGTSSWVHGADIVDPSDSDGIQRLRRDDLVSFAGVRSFGKNEATNLLNVKKVPKG